MRELEIYVHIPFCRKKCDYCDFLSFIKGAADKKKYIEALMQEVESVAERIGDYEVVTVFIGGGTPSIIEATDIQRIMEQLKSHFHFVSDPEVTIEANPGTLTPEKLQTYVASGINRISIGLQTADDEELQRLGRIHSYEQFELSFRQAREAGFSNINIDVMAGLPGQSIDSYRTTLLKVLSFKPEHISSYGLIVEPDTPFYRRYDGHEELLPSEEAERQMYEMTREMLAKEGYERYEISNYAKKGYLCQHNIGYWQRREYLGIGLGASSLLGNARWKNSEDFGQYIAGQAERIEYQQLSRIEEMEEFMFLGLRMTSGVRFSRFKTCFGTDMFDIYKETINKLIADGLLMVNGDYIKLTDRGLDLSNHVLSELLF